MRAAIQKDPTKTIQQNISHEKQHFRIDSYSFRNLTPRYREAALNLLEREFGRQEPLTQAYSRKYPNNPSTPAQWRLFFSFLMGNVFTNNLSVGVFENDKLIAVFLCDAISFLPQEFMRTFCEEKEVAHTFILLLESELKKKVDSKVEEFISQTGKTVDFFGVAIDKDYTGTRILFKNMLALVEKLARDAGYTHGYIYATNQKTNIVAKRANYELISTLNVKELVLRDQIPFSEVDDFHKNPSIWLKKL